VFLIWGFRALSGVSSCRVEKVNVGEKRILLFLGLLSLLSCHSLLPELLLEMVDCSLGAGSSQGNN